MLWNSERAYFCFFIIQLCSFSLCSGQINEYFRFLYYNGNNGLNSSNVQKIVEDSKGFIWLSTQDGLFRFDGVNFTVYNSYNSGNPNHLLTGSVIRGLALNRDTLWVISAYGGIDAIDIVSGSVIYSITESQHSDNGDTKPPLFWSISFIQNKLFLGGDGGLAYLDVLKKKLINVPLTLTEEKDIVVYKSIADSSQNLWLLSNKGAFLLNPKTLHVIDYYKDSITIYYDVETAGRESIFAGYDRGIKRYELNRGKIICKDDPFYQISESLNTDIFTIKKDRFGTIYFSNKNYLIKVNNESKFSFVRKNQFNPQQDWTEAVFGIYFDKKNNIWLGCQQGLAFSNNKPTPFLSFNKGSLSQDIINHCYFLCPVNDSMVYVCAEDGLYIVNKYNGDVRTIDFGKTYFYMFKTYDNKLIVTSDEGSYSLVDKSLNPVSDVYQEFKQFGKLIFNSQVYINDSVVILGTQNQKGLYIWDFKHRKVEHIYASVKKAVPIENTVNNLYKDSLNRIWVLSDNSIMLYNFEKKLIQEIEIKNKNRTYTIFYDVKQVGANFYLASYDNGVIVVDKAFHFLKEISTNNGLSNNGVYKLLPYHDSLMFVTSNNGLSTVNLHNGKIKNYYQPDGLQSDEFEEFSGNERNGFLYAGGLNGFTIINPKYFTTNTTPPKFYFTSIKTQTTGSQQSNDTSNLEMTELKIANTWLQTNVSFVGLNYSNPERVIYRYKIKEQDTSWRDLGTQNFVSILGLPPGTYTLQVKAANEDGVWCQPKTLTLIFLPKWYQTLVFDIAVALALLGLMYAFYRYRIRQLKKQQEIRVGIASDLHDDIGSALNTVKVFTHLAKRDIDKTEHINQIEESLTQATAGLRDMIWILDDTQDTIQEILDRIKKFAMPVTMANGIKLECINLAETGEQAVSKTEKRNLLLIAKEGINNCIKYAGCTNIQVLLNQQNKKITLTITDNGSGFNVASAPPGNGLKNIQHRAKQINAVAEITSVANEGTVIKVIQL